MTLQKFIDQYGRSKLAKDLGVTRQAITEWYKGRNLPSLVRIRKIISLSKGKLSLKTFCK